MGQQASLRQLIEQVKRGDEQSATQLVRQYEPELRRFVRYRLSDPRLRTLLDSLDVTQSVFARLFTGLAADRLEVANSRQFVKLLCTMATNRVRDHARRTNAAKRGAGHRQWERQPLETVAESAAEPGDALATLDLVDVFRRQLDEADRDLLERRLRGEGWQEIAAEVGGTPDAVRKRFTRAVDGVARQLDLLES